MCLWNSTTRLIITHLISLRRLMPFPLASHRWWWWGTPSTEYGACARTGRNPCRRAVRYVLLCDAWPPPSASPCRTEHPPPPLLRAPWCDETVSLAPYKKTPALRSPIMCVCHVVRCCSFAVWLHALWHMTMCLHLLCVLSSSVTRSLAAPAMSDIKERVMWGSAIRTACEISCFNLDFAAVKFDDIVSARYMLNWCAHVSSTYYGLSKFKAWSRDGGRCGSGEGGRDECTFVNCTQWRHFIW